MVLFCSVARVSSLVYVSSGSSSRTLLRCALLILVKFLLDLARQVGSHGHAGSLTSSLETAYLFFFEINAYHFFAYFSLTGGHGGAFLLMATLYMVFSHQSSIFLQKSDFILYFFCKKGRKCLFRANKAVELGCYECN